VTSSPPPAAAPVRAAFAPGSTAAPVRVLGWGDALPAHRGGQAELAAGLAAALSPARGRRLKAAFRGSQIDARHSVLPDFAPGRPPRLFRGGSPSTAQRMVVFAEEAPGLAEAAAREALEAAALAPVDVTHLLFITCTGFAAPGPDRDLVLRLGLSPAVRRVQIGYQGCSAGIVGLRTAAEIVRGEPDARVLVTAVELASLHFQTDPEDDDLRGHALFADGAGAAVVGADGAGRGGARVALGRGASRLLAGSERDMTWDVGDAGFRMRLSSRVPDALALELPAFASALADVAPEDVAHWAVHPGGPVILDRVRDTLGLPEERLHPSRDVLRRCGNMSSATVFFVFRRILETGSPGDGVALAFGPGLTVEGLRFRVEA
jgi:predicted naringenin-chalcone synthase